MSDVAVPDVPVPVPVPVVPDVAVPDVPVPVVPDVAVPDVPVPEPLNGSGSPREEAEDASEAEDPEFESE